MSKRRISVRRPLDQAAWRVSSCGKRPVPFSSRSRAESARRVPGNGSHPRLVGLVCAAIEVAADVIAASDARNVIDVVRDLAQHRGDGRGERDLHSDVRLRRDSGLGKGLELGRQCDDERRGGEVGLGLRRRPVPRECRPSRTDPTPSVAEPRDVRVDHCAALARSTRDRSAANDSRSVQGKVIVAIDQRHLR